MIINYILNRLLGFKLRFEKISINFELKIHIFQLAHNNFKKQFLIKQNFIVQSQLVYN